VCLAKKNTADVSIPSIGKVGKLGKEKDGWTPFIRRDSDVRMKDADFILHGISRKEFENLDAIVEEFDRQYPSGKFYSENFYNMFKDYRDIGGSSSHKFFDRYRENLKIWAEKNPEAGAPAIARAAFEINLAWAARGGGFADTVSEKAWVKFHQHIKNARTILEVAPELAKQDVNYYDIWLTIHLAEGSDLDEFQKTFEAGADLMPTFTPLYLSMAYALQPKWYGDTPRDWHRWLVNALIDSELSEEEKLLLYGHVVRQNLRGEYNRMEGNALAVYEMHGVDKTKFMKGLSACCAEYKDSTDWPSAYLYHSVWAQDKNAIKEALQLMDHKYAPGVFGGKEDFFHMIDYLKAEYPEFLSLME